MKLVEHIERWPLTRLSPYAHNARIHSADQVAQIAASIKTFGFNNPILVDAQGGIIAGHGRFAAATKLGLTEAPVILLDHLTDRERRAYIIADNKLAENATWDDAVLAAELAALNEEEFDLSILGFDDRELEKLLATEDDDGRADECPPVPEAATTVLGDLWLLGRHRVLCGDATDGAAVARVMAGAKAQLCFTSPPYNAGKSESLSNNSHTTDNKYLTAYDDDVTHGEYLSLLCGFTDIALHMAECVAINIQQLAGNKLAVLEYLYKYRRHVIDTAVWTKTNPQPAMARNVMTSAFEYIFFLGPSPDATRVIPTADFRGTVQNVYSSAVNSGNAYSVCHAAVFPVAFAEWVITAFTRAQSCLCDPFSGTGTTLIACEKTKRTCYGMELSPEYCDVIVTRWQDYTGKQATLDGDGRTFAEVRAARLPAS